MTIFLTVAAFMAGGTTTGFALKYVADLPRKHWNAHAEKIRTAEDVDYFKRLNRVP